jgi:hypothetical protein
MFCCPHAPFHLSPLIIKIVVAPIVTILPRPDSDLNHSYLYLLGARADSTSGVSRDPYKRGARTGMSQPAAVLATACLAAKLIQKVARERKNWRL